MTSFNLKVYLIIEKLMIEANQNNNKDLEGELRDFSIIPWDLLTQEEQKLLHSRRGLTADEKNTTQFILPKYEITK